MTIASSIGSTDRTSIVSITSLERENIIRDSRIAPSELHGAEVLEIGKVASTEGFW